MTTNRTRRTRGRIGFEGLTNEAYIFFKWNGTIANDFSDGKTESEILAFWNQHRDAIMTRYLDEMEQRKDFSGKRPSFYFYEMEKKKPRRKTGTHKWIGPVRSDGGDRTIIDDVFETDFQYLKRLGLLEPWELAAEPVKTKSQKLK
jgi:hypothetical protein